MCRQYYKLWSYYSQILRFLKDRLVVLCRTFGKVHSFHLIQQWLVEWRRQRRRIEGLNSVGKNALVSIKQNGIGQWIFFDNLWISWNNWRRQNLADQVYWFIRIHIEIAIRTIYHYWMKCCIRTERNDANNAYKREATHSTATIHMFAVFAHTEIHGIISLHEQMSGDETSRLRIHLSHSIETIKNLCL